MVAGLPDCFDNFQTGENNENNEFENRKMPVAPASSSV